MLRSRGSQSSAAAGVLSSAARYRKKLEVRSEPLSVYALKELSYNRPLHYRSHSARVSGMGETARGMTASGSPGPYCLGPERSLTL